MSSDLLKTLTVSLTSSFCTALFVVACTAGAEKPSETSAEDGEWGSDADDDGGSDVGAFTALEAGCRFSLPALILTANNQRHHQQRNQCKTHGPSEGESLY